MTPAEKMKARLLGLEWKCTENGHSRYVYENGKVMLFFGLNHSLSPTPSSYSLHDRGPCEDCYLPRGNDDPS